ncbi:protein FAR1-RELATED SEQUENCE 5-like [Henckelia pumila]|uniref:protein FAR1-RELATED SEQUENCE 5-like n=1 Tax=Henckelia pumila TaxID=405737 RepID=UPI003C6E625F
MEHCDHIFSAINNISDTPPDLVGGITEEVDVANMHEDQNGVSGFLITEHIQVPSANSIIEQLESRLVIGQVVRSVEDAYLLYCNYAHAKGFSVKKGDQRYFPGTSELQAKDFECSCEGGKDEKCSSERIPVYLKPITRTKCKAKLRITRQHGGEWKVGNFVMEHNHEMVAADQRHLLRSSRSISYAQKSTLEAMVNAGISVANAVSYMENEAHGPQNLRFIRKDAYDHIVRIRKHTKVENRDASALLRYFIDKSNSESHFYWNVQLDDDDRIMNFFFRDYRCQVDYEYFGDVLSVDTTYRTNRYNLICAPFVGINHHKQNVMFGLAFMSDETESSFEWLFKTFLDSMNEKQPQTIFTDQCQAMMNAIEKVFSSAHHRLCQWHINQNAPSHLGSLNGDSNFKRMWHNCMSHCESEEDFEAKWRIMIDEYNLSDHKWLNKMYTLRYKWATAFSNHKFSAGLLATSRSEVTNAILKKLGNSAISLYEFVLNYEKIQKKWRENEKVEDTRCLHGKAATMLKNHPLLNCAANVYTLTIFKLFEMELINSLNTTLIKFPSDLSSYFLEFEVKSHGENTRVRTVVFNKETHELRCSCHKFESMGILCKHALKVFDFMNVNVIPESYLKKRWMKNSRNRIFDEVIYSESESGHESEIVFVNQIMRSTHVLSMRCKAHADTRNKLIEIIDTAKKEIDGLFEDLRLADPNVCNNVLHERMISWIKCSYVILLLSSPEELRMLTLYVIGMTRAKKEKKGKM